MFPAGRWRCPGLGPASRPTSSLLGAAAPDVDSPAASPPTVARAASIARLPEINQSPEQRTDAVEFPSSPAVDRSQDDVTLPVAVQRAIQAAAVPRADLPTFSVHAFGFVAVGICAAWLLIAAASFARLGVGWWRMARLRSAAAPVDVLTWQICDEMANRLGVAAPEVLRSPCLPSPCLAGILRPVVLLPAADLGLSIRDVFVHELAHLARRDCHWNLLRLSTRAAFFFQPLLWMLSRRLEVTAEEVCDDYVVQYDGDRFEYAHRLVDIAELCAAPVAAAGVGIVSLRSMLARRVQRIMDSSRALSTRVGSLLLTAIIAGGLLGTAMVGLVGINPKPSVADDAPVAAEDKTSDDKSEPAPGTLDPQPPAAESAPAEKAASAPRPDALAMVSFQRDALQLTPSPFDVWSLAFSADDQFLAVSGGGGWNDQNPGQGADLGFRKGTRSCLLSHGARQHECGPLARRAAIGRVQLGGGHLAARSGRGRIAPRDA